MSLFNRKPKPKVEEPSLVYHMSPDRLVKHSVRYKATTGLAVYLPKDDLLHTFGGEYPESIVLEIRSNAQVPSSSES